MAQDVITFDHVSKKFSLHRERARSFQDLVLGLFRRDEKVIPYEEREAFWALKDVSFSINQGETVGIIGPNGAGKSTILKLLTRIIEPTSGHVEISGRVGALLELGAGFHPDLTGRENIYMYGSILGLNRVEIDQRLDEIINFAELERFIDVPVKHYSSGMYVRLGFSVAVHTEPEVLLIDEVLAVGDQEFRHKCLLKIESMQQKGLTIVLVSHNMEQISQVCDRVVWIDQGHLKASGVAAELIKEYTGSLVAEEHRLRSEALSTLQANGQAVEKVDNDSLPMKRWGNGDIVITGMRLLESDGCAARTFHPDQPMRVEFDYAVRNPVDDWPSFGVAIYRKDGLWCYGTNTGIDGYGFAQAALPASGTMVAELSAVQLLEGEYTIDLAVHSTNSESMYDYVKSGLWFNVVNPGGDRGVFRPELDWYLYERGEE